jgi:hypothetical protein
VGLPPLRVIAKPYLPIALSILWLASIGGGFTTLFEHQMRAGDPILAPERLPDDVRSLGWSVSAERFELFLFLHPKCPCSDATLENLNRLSAQTRGAMSVRLVMFDRGEGEESWSDADSVRAALSLPHTSLTLDPGGSLAARFGARTSGSVALYDDSGVLRFHGGLTDSRGHPGSSAGIAAIARIVTTGIGLGETTPVFGCPIFVSDPTRDERAGVPRNETAPCEDCQDEAGFRGATESSP